MDGKIRSAFAMTERNVASSDATNIESSIKRDGDHYVLDGEKTWISNGGLADFYCVFARTDPAAGSRGITAFVVEADTPGLTIAERIDVMSPHPLALLRFEGCRVPASHMLGEANKGFKRTKCHHVTF